MTDEQWLRLLKLAQNEANKLSAQVGDNPIQLAGVVLRTADDVDEEGPDVGWVLEIHFAVIGHAFLRNSHLNLTLALPSTMSQSGTLAL